MGINEHRSGCMYRIPENHLLWGSFWDNFIDPGGLMLHVGAEHVFLRAVGAFSHNLKLEVMAGQTLFEAS